MGLSKSTRIMILLGIDTVFFFVELIAGYTVHSLALVADSFHMVRISPTFLRRILTGRS
jgi:zinc transporter 1